MLHSTICAHHYVVLIRYSRNRYVRVFWIVYLWYVTFIIWAHACLITCTVRPLAMLLKMIELPNLVPFYNWKMMSLQLLWWRRNDDWGTFPKSTEAGSICKHNQKRFVRFTSCLQHQPSAVEHYIGSSRYENYSSSSFSPLFFLIVTRAFYLFLVFVLFRFIQFIYGANGEILNCFKSAFSSSLTCQIF